MIDWNMNDYRGWEKVSQVYLIRHGATEGNKLKQYIGCRTDQPITMDAAQELREIRYRQDILETKKFNHIFMSPMLRCRQTAGLLLPGTPKTVIPGWKETDFGRFEGKSYEDLKEDLEYQEWMASMGTMPFPDGESRKEFGQRVSEGFCQAVLLMEEIRRHADYPDRPIRTAFVIHGGVIMSLLSTYGDGDYYDYQCANGDGFKATLLEDGQGQPKLVDIHPLNWTNVPEDQNHD